ncbi:MAG: 50S ribosomal protein L11 methyltransferase [Zetaproteobacteria bacterium]|nr:50S ribosomal protein L11 methyltransferase [Pseudobdellovibrionaceae bacterium]|tara:strand:- start:3 stop:956 length:954 start_codon:yes stop_codon:yes gene_type:complete
MKPVETYELKVKFPENISYSSYEHFKDKLLSFGVSSYVEGVQDNIDKDQSLTTLDNSEIVHDFDKKIFPLSIYSYDQSEIDRIDFEIRKNFKDLITTEKVTLTTESWTEGWKDYFKPIETSSFYIYPPWESKVKGIKKHLIVMDPGFAFGTGQHSTTQLCLSHIEQYFELNKPSDQHRALDLGCGSGILAISLAKLGYNNIEALDIDADAVLAAEKNAKENHVSYLVEKGSSSELLEKGKKLSYDLIVANILWNVLEKIIFDLKKLIKPGGEIILSGLLNEQADQMIHLADQAGFSFCDKKTQEGWCSIKMKSRLLS